MEIIKVSKNWKKAHNNIVLVYLLFILDHLRISSQRWCVLVILLLFSRYFKNIAGLLLLEIKYIQSKSEYRQNSDLGGHLSSTVVRQKNIGLMRF